MEFLLLFKNGSCKKKNRTILRLKIIDSKAPPILVVAITGLNFHSRITKNIFEIHVESDSFKYDSPTSGISY